MTPQLSLFENLVELAQPEPRASALFTFGYGNKPSSAFAPLLDEYAIDLVLDVRRSPRTGNPGWSRESLQQALGERYQHCSGLGNSKSAREAEWIPTNREAANAALTWLAELLESGKRLLLLCAEPDPAGCHRTVIAALLGQFTPLR